MSELARHASEIKKNDAMNLIGYQVLEIESSHHHACTPHAGHRSSKSSSHIGHESCPKQVKGRNFTYNGTLDVLHGDPHGIPLKISIR